MTYIRVKWFHPMAEEPVFLYSDIDTQRWEVRKVDVFSNGTMGYADRFHNTPGTRTMLSDEPVAELAEIAQDPQFEPTEITKEEFEEVWNKATR